MLTSLWTSVTSLVNELALIETNTIMLVILLVISVIVVDGVTLLIARLRKESGFEAKTKAVGVDGGKAVPTKNYISDTLQLAGRPDAVIVENGFSIPVEHKPLARKIHDRYVAQLLVYMRLIEENTGKRPPYGYLIIGATNKKVRIENSDKKQAWLDTLLREMHSILEGRPSVPTPHPRKCRRCEVREFCEHKVEDKIPKRRDFSDPNKPKFR